MLPKNSVFRIICTFLFCGLWLRSKADVFTAMSDCESLLDTYKLVIDDLDRYIQKEESRLIALKRNLETYKEEYRIAMGDISNYLGNPINAFILIKRLTTDVNEIEKNIANKKIKFVKNVTRHNEKAKYPDNKDLYGAGTALRRLQETYKLQVNDLAEGKINGVPYSLSMKASDCYELGRVMYKLGDYKNNILWMSQVLKKHKEEQSDTCSFTEVEIIDQISRSYYKLGDNRNALVWLKKLLALDPSHTAAQNKILWLEQKNALIDEKTEDELLTSKNEETPKTYKTNDEKYEALCRGEFETAPEISKRLKCFYLTKNHPFLRLAPIKAEQYYMEPDVFVFYDVISDREIEHVKAVAKPNFQRAKVLNPNTGKLIDVEYRISKLAFLEEDNVTRLISQRVTDFTGLSMETAESLQVANYGIGGHYEPHYDQSLTLENTTQGNRIATVLFYMSEVAQGGATVFTVLGLSVFPIKNAALFWMNLHPSGQADLSTLHGGCPVLRGSKWVSNKWIRFVGQEFRRPCSLKYQPQGILRQHPAPIPKCSSTPSMIMHD